MTQNKVLNNASSKEQLYFIALVPGQPLFDKIMKIKNEVAEKYSSKAALKSPPHITLYMPFRWKDTKEQVLFDVLRNISSEFQSFSIKLQNFAAFEPRVIFINPLENDILDHLQKNVIKFFKRELKLFDKGFEKRPFHPHVTIAFRDLKKPMFWKAWNENFKNREFSADFEVNQVSLMKHDGQKWLVYKNFPLEG